MNFQIPGNMNVKISPCISTVFIIPSMISNEILMLIYWNVINQDYGISKKKLPSMMYNEEAKIMYRNFNITYRYFRFFAMSLFLHTGERMKSCFAGTNPTVGLAGGSLRC